jgi:3-oxoadipate enol-lactonase
MILEHRIEGPKTGLPLLLVHPLGADQRFWDECRRHFGPDVLTVSCDLRGSGASPDLTEPLRIEQTADNLEDLRRHLGLDKIVVVGCAVGAMATAVHTSRYPESTAALVMANPGFRITPAGAANLRERAEFVRKSGMKALLPAAIENAFFGYGETEARKIYEARFVTQKPENYAFACLGSAEGDISGCGDISCPVLSVPGRNDKLFGMPHAEEVARMLPDAAMVEFENGAHFIPYQQPREFGETVAAFLKQSGLLQGAA